jgi:hypothetical protein
MNRFWNKVNIPSLSDCWEWQGSKNKHGYGHFKYKRKTHRAHRISWTLIKGEIPEGMCVLHRCDNRLCVNPFHLFLGTNQDNMDDKMKKNRHHSSQKTHCPQGHPYSEDNTYWTKREAHRLCRACDRARKFRKYERKSIE